MVHIGILVLLTIFLSITGLSTVYGATAPIPYDYDRGSFEITDVSLKKNSYSSEIIGFLKNVDPNLNTIDGVSLTLEMYDKNNHLIGVDTAYPVTQKFRPDQKSPFKFSSLDNEEDLDHIHIGILATDWGTATPPSTPDLSSETNRTFTDCYSDATKDLISHLSILPIKLKLNVTDPGIKKTITNMCNFYNEKLGLWVNITNDRYRDALDQYGQEFYQKYGNTFPYLFKQYLEYTNPNPTVGGPWIGMLGLSLTPDLSEQIFGMNQTKGFLLTSITKGSPAEKYGLKAGTIPFTIDGRYVNVGGDIIQRIDNREVLSIYDITAYVKSQKHVGDKVNLTILRGNAIKELDLILGAAPSQDTPINDNRLPQNGDGNSPEELYDDCVRVAGKGLCDFLFRK